MRHVAIVGTSEPVVNNTSVVRSGFPVARRQALADGGDVGPVAGESRSLSAPAPRADVEMVQGRDRARLAPEPGSPVGIGGELVGETLMATVRSRRVSRAR
jgi:hypothetical protein